MIVSRMLLIVSMVSCSEVVLLFSLLSSVGVKKLGCGLGVPGCCDSLPKVLRAFSENERERVKEKLRDNISFRY